MDFESCQLADAVALEPVSSFEFPANKEIIRESPVLWRKRHKKRIRPVPKFCAWPNFTLSQP